jgi:hypothetical protein
MIMIPATGLLAFLAVLYCGFLIVRGMAEGLPEVKSYAVESKYVKSELAQSLLCILVVMFVGFIMALLDKFGWL